jgi:hypothetical protein
LNIDGTANIDSLVADTADINGGTIDGTAIGVTTPSTGAFTTLSATGQITSSRARSDTLGDVGLAFGAVSQWGWRDDNSNRANLDFYNGATWSNMLQVTGGTGLAVMGTLSATGNGSFAGAYGSVSVTSNTGTNGADVRFINTGGTYYVGVDSSTGGAFGATAYDMIHFLPTGRGLSTVISGSGVVTRVSSTGLAVTGALSSTGALAIGNTVATAVAVASTHKVTIVIGGVTYYLLATNV